MIVEKQVLPFLVWFFGDGQSPSAFSSFVWTTIVLALIGLALGFLVSIFRYGPSRGLRNLLRTLVETPRDLLLISPRRVVGLTYLAMREANRRHVWVALLLFLVLLMFAGWNMAPKSDKPAEIYLNFVLSAATIIMLPVAVFAAAFSIPMDIKNRTIYTVTTKPVRPSEIVLGRILGFSATATSLLAIMAVCSYVFVARGLDHSHQLTADMLTVTTFRGEPVRYSGQTSSNHRHVHDVSVEVDEFFPEIELDAVPGAGGIVVSRLASRAAAAGLQTGDIVTSIDGIQVAGQSVVEAVHALEGRAGTSVRLVVQRAGVKTTVDVPRTVSETSTEANRGHKHRVIARWSDGGAMKYEVGPPEGMFVARVPKYGRLRFRDSEGDPKDEKSWVFKTKGTNVGKIFNLRSYIRGNTLAAAVWTFDGITPEAYPDGLNLDVNISVFRSHMGQLDAPIAGSLIVRNPLTGAHSQERIFAGKEFTVDRMTVPRKIWNSRDQLVDLFDDNIVTKDDPSTPEDEGGRIEVWISCVDPGQYFGMSEADVYIRAQDASYDANFAKGFVGIWLQIVLVTALAVLFSTFLSGPVAMLLSFTTVLLGFNKDFLTRLTQSVLDPASVIKMATHERIYGGGPIESFYRIITQRNLTSQLEDNLLKSFIEEGDFYLMLVVEKLLHLLPDFEQFVEVQYLSHGYNIQIDMLLQHICAVLAFLFAAYVMGYFSLKSREMAR